MLPFLGLTFAISWGSWAVVLVHGGSYLTPIVLPFFLTGSFGPLLAAGIMRASTRGERTPAIVGSRRRRPSRWVPLALALGSAGALIAALGTAAIGEPGPDLGLGARSLNAYGSPVLFFLVNLVVGPASEEPGWRGYLNPRLRQHASPLRAALLLGPVWALWHLPLFLIPGTYQHSLGVLTTGGLLFLISTIALGVAVAYAAERLGGLTAAIGVHAASNTAPVLLGLTSETASVWDAAAKIAVAAILLWRWRPISGLPARHTAAPNPKASSR